MGSGQRQADGQIWRLRPLYGLFSQSGVGFPVCFFELLLFMGLISVKFGVCRFHWTHLQLTVGCIFICTITIIRKI